ncbi:MAG: methyltransferase domain-containing protein [Pseudomonadota bacterium]
MHTPAVSLYESPEIREVTGETIRPGGFSLTDRAVPRCGFSHGNLILDAGCGTGATVERLVTRHGLRAVGVDISRLLLSQGAAKNQNRTLAVATIPRLPFKPGVFDGVFCECVLSLVPDRAGTLRGFCDVLKPDGYLVLTDIYARSDRMTPDLPVPGVRTCINGALPLDTLSGLVTGAGFTIHLIEDHSALLRELAVRLIFEFGSLSQFWGSWCSKETATETRETVNRLKPGYYLLIAQKN